MKFEETAVSFNELEGKMSISLLWLADYYEVPFKQASRKLTENSELFRDLGLGAAKVYADGKLVDVNLTIRDAATFLTLLNYKRYTGERKSKLIRLKNWMSDLAQNAIEGNLLFNVDALTDDQKKIASHNNLRRALYVKKVREAHPDSPNTFRRLHNLAHNDQELIQGPQVEFVAGWHKGLPKDQMLKDSAQKMASFAAIACGHIDPESINRFERDLFKGLPEKFIPDYIPRLKDATRQVCLQLV